MRSTSALIVVASFLLVQKSAGHKCDSLKNVKMTVLPDEGDAYNATVNGCIERTAFDKTITQAYIKHQYIPRLGVDSVRNMKHLHGVQFYRCQLSIIEPGAFRNMPGLRSIQIVANDVVHIPKGVFQLVPSLEIVKLNNNKIYTIEDEAFSDLPVFKKLYLDHNQLQNWGKGWFKNTTKVQVIDFQFNKLKILPSKAFEGLTQLKEVYLDYNELDTISPQAFEGVRNLEILGLKYNRLKSIDSKAFPDKIVIKSWRIDANYLTFLPREVLTNVQVKELIVDGNPWKCSCLDQIFLWMHETNATTKSTNCVGGNVPVCSFPSSFSKTCKESVDEEVITAYLDRLRQVKPPLSIYCARLN